MKRVTLSLIIMVAIAATIPVLARGPAGGMAAAPSAGPTLTQPGRTSPHDAINVHVGSQRGPLVAIYYGRPYSKSPTNGDIRKIWGSKADGALVPWDAVWRLGSDEGTTIITQADLMFGDFVLPAGAYTLEMLPVEKGPSKLIINKAIGYWGIPYSAIQAQEMKQLDLTKEPDLDKQVDQLTLSLSNANGGSVLKITWEKSVYSIAFKLKS